MSGYPTGLRRRTHTKTFCSYGKRELYFSGGLSRELTFHYDLVEEQLRGCWLWTSDVIGLHLPSAPTNLAMVKDYGICGPRTSGGLHFPYPCFDTKNSL